MVTESDRQRAIARVTVAHRQLKKAFEDWDCTETHQARTYVGNQLSALRDKDRKLTDDQAESDESVEEKPTEKESMDWAAFVLESIPEFVRLTHSLIGRVDPKPEKPKVPPLVEKLRQALKSLDASSTRGVPDPINFYRTGVVNLAREVLKAYDEGLREPG